MLADIGVANRPLAVEDEGCWPRDVPALRFVEVAQPERINGGEGHVADDREGESRRFGFGAGNLGRIG